MGHRLLWGRPTTPPVAILPFAWCLLFLSLAAQTPSATNPPPPGSRFQLSLPNDASSLLSLAFCLLHFVDISDHSPLSLPVSLSSGFMPISILSLPLRDVSDRKQR